MNRHRNTFKYINVFYCLRYQEILRFHLSEGDSEQVLATCKRFGHQDPNLWVQALWSVAKNKDAPIKLLADILAYIGEYICEISIMFNQVHSKILYVLLIHVKIS